MMQELKTCTENGKLNKAKGFGMVPTKCFKNLNQQCLLIYYIF